MFKPACATLSVEKLEELSEALLDFQARHEVAEWLQVNTEAPQTDAPE